MGASASSPRQPHTDTSLQPTYSTHPTHTKCPPTKTKAPTHPSCCSSTPWESWTIGTAHRSHCSHQELEGKTQVESTQQGLRGAGVPLHRHHAALTTKHQTAARSPQLLLDAKQLHHPTTPTGDKGTAGSLPPLDRGHQDLGKKNN